MTAKPFFLTIFVLLKRQSIALAFAVGLLLTVASMQLLGQSRAYVANHTSTRWAVCWVAGGGGGGGVSEKVSVLC